MTESPTSSKRRPIGLWISLTCLVLLLFAVAMVTMGWAVRRVFMTGRGTDAVLTAGQKAAVMQIAEFPINARAALRHLMTGEQTSPLLLRKGDRDQTGWVRQFPAPQDDGYLLFAGLYKGESTSGVKLIRVSDGNVMASWSPDWRAVAAGVTRKRFDADVDLSNARAVNPVLLDDGDIFFSTGAAAVRESACSATPRWVLDEAAHHSNDLDVDGTSVWVPAVSSTGFEGNEVLHKNARDDAIGRISLDGKMLERRSIAGILGDNGLAHLMFNGTGNFDFNSDPIHLNQIKVAHADSEFWKKGDLLISMRNTNTVLLYRPSTNKVVWRQTGPWLHQHSADFVDDHRISVFNNNVVLSSPTAPHFLTPHDINEVMVYDFRTGQITQPFQSLLQAAHPITVGEGRARLLPDGGLFLEETDNGRLMRFTKDKLLWAFVNDHDDQHVGALAWSSYLTADEARKPLAAIAAQHCLAAEAASPAASR